MGDDLTCGCCGKPYGLNYTPCGERTIMERDKVCFSCAFWTLKADKFEKRRDPRMAAIDGYLYYIGEERRHSSAEFRGMAGRPFAIEFTDGRPEDQRVVRTTNLWANGEIPEHFKGRIPDNARFGGGARSTVVGGIRCWDQSQ